VAHEVMRETLRPVVREALTEDVLAAIAEMVGLTPKAVQMLKLDLEAEDSTVRQRAYTLLLKYTVGHPAVVQPSDADPGKQMVVNFNLPRPADAQGEDSDIVSAEAESLRVCVVCAADKPESEFVANSDRCWDCHRQMQSKIEELLGDGPDGD
jgi:hypothetical protein